MPRMRLSLEASSGTRSGASVRAAQGSVSLTTEGVPLLRYGIAVNLGQTVVVPLVVGQLVRTAAWRKIQPWGVPWSGLSRCVRVPNQPRGVAAAVVLRLRYDGGAALVLGEQSSALNTLTPTFAPTWSPPQPTLLI